MAEETDEARAAADAVLVGVRAALRGLEAVSDPAVRATAAGLVLREWAGEKTLPKEIRQQAVAHMHEQLGMDFPEIAGLIGTDRSRAWQIYRGI
ncbi:hypothetical protein [Streptomyces sp. NPDC004135]